jgi:hypothetical protein
MSSDAANSGSLAFLRTELETAGTFLSIAEQAADDAKILRNRENARKALECVRYFMGKTLLSGEEATEIRAAVKELAHRLRQLDKLKF